MDSITETDSFEDFCPKCLHFEEKTGVCKRLYENVREYPGKFYSKCDGDFYEYDPKKHLKERSSKDRNSESYVCSDCGCDFLIDDKVCAKCGADASEIKEDENENSKSFYTQPRKEPRFWASNIAFTIGILSFLGTLSSVASERVGSDPLAGLFIIVGALVYKSIKKRKYGLSQDTSNRKSWEILALLLIFSLLLFQDNYLERMERDPITNFVIPLAVLMLCGIMFFKSSGDSYEQSDNIESTRICANCGTSISVSDKYCSACGTGTQHECAKCQSVLSKNASFCSHCGAAV